MPATIERKFVPRPKPKKKKKVLSPQAKRQLDKVYLNAPPELQEKIALFIGVKPYVCSKEGLLEERHCRICGNLIYNKQKMRLVATGSHDKGRDYYVAHNDCVRHYTD